MAHEKTFYLNGGKTFKDLKGLAKELKDMANETFEHHVTPYKNDFAKWVEHSLNKDKFAKKLEKKIDIIEMELEILRHLVHDEVKKVVKKASKKRDVVKKMVLAEKKAEEKKATPVKKVVVKKAVVKKVAVKKAVAKKPVVKKVVTKKTAPKKPVVKKAAPKKTNSESKK